MELTYEYSPHDSPDTKVKAAKDHGKNHIKVRAPLVGDF